MPLSIIQLHRNLYWLSCHNITPLSKEELQTVNAYYERIKEFPIERERLYWAPDLLRRLDEKLDHETAKYQAKLISILTRIVTDVA